MPDGEPAERTAALEPLWQAYFYEPAALAFKQYDSAVPAVSPDGSRVYVGAADGLVRCVRAATGDVIWSFDTGERVEAAPRLEGGSIYVGSLSGKVYRLDAKNGQMRWEYDTASPILSTPALGGGRVFFVNDKNTVFALDAKTGKFLWKKARSHTDEFTVTGQAGVLVGNNAIFTGFSDGNLVALLPEDGAVAWSRYLGESSRRLVDVDTTPVIEGSTLYAAAFRGGLYALDPETGFVKWRYEAEGIRGPVVRRSTIWVTAGDREVHCLRSNDGSVLWKARLPSGSPAPPVVDGSWLFVSTDDYLAVLSAASGQVAQLVPTVEGVGAMPIVHEGKLFVMSNGGRFYAMLVRH